MVLGEFEIRVLGVMIEKSLTQSSGYPMTVNSITLGANQLQNREPVVSYGESEVSAALRNIIHKGLAVQAPPSSGARAVRFEHRVVEHFHWDRRDQAVMAELMLRGRQTAGELRTHASRMTPLPDLPAVTAILDALKAHDPPFIEELPREPGRSANRFRHLLGAGGTPTVAPPAPETHDAPIADSLEGRVSKLETQVAELKAVVAGLGKTVSSNIDAHYPPKV